MLSPRVGRATHGEIDWEGLLLGRDFDIYALPQGREFAPGLGTLIENVTPGAGNWHSVGAYAWGIWLWLPWKCQIPLGLPPIPHPGA